MPYIAAEPEVALARGREVKWAITVNGMLTNNVIGCLSIHSMHSQNEWVQDEDDGISNSDSGCFDG